MECHCQYRLMVLQRCRKDFLTRGVGGWGGGTIYIKLICSTGHAYRVGMAQIENLGGGGACAPGAPPPPPPPPPVPSLCGSVINLHGTVLASSPGHCPPPRSV